MSDGEATAKKEVASNEANSSKESRVAIRLMVVLNSRRSLAGGIHFLERRGYQITVVNRIMDAVQQLGTIKPHAVLLSWNLKNTDVRKTYKVLTEKFKLVCVVFAEDNMTRTTTSLMGSGIPHSLLAPVSGPSIHMRIQALLRSRAGIDRTRKRRKPDYSRQDDRVSVKSPINFGDMPPHLKWNKVEDKHGKHHWEAADEATDKRGKQKVYYFRGEDPPQYDEGKKTWSFSSGKSGPVYMEERDVTDEHSATQEGLDGKGFSFTQESQEGQEHSSTQEGHQEQDASEKQPGRRRAGYSFSQEEKQDEGYSFSQEEHQGLSRDGATYETSAAGSDLESPPADPWESDLAQEIEKDLANLSKELVSEGEEDSSNSGEAADQTDEEKPVDPHEAADLVITNEDAQKNNNEKSAAQYAEGDFVRKTAEYSIAESTTYKSAKTALESSTLLPETHIQNIDQVAMVALALVHSTRVRGFLLGVCGSGKSMQDFMTQMVSKFWNMMKEQGEEQKEPSQIIEFSVAPFPFKPWAEEHAEFFMARPHGDDTIGLAFFKVDEFPQLKEVSDDKVLGISLQSDIKGDNELLFNVYLHLPKNKKFLRYTSKGSVLTTKALTKFLNFGIKDLYIHKEDRDLFYAYWVRNLLETKKK